MINKIRRRCECGCGSLANCGRVYINSHHLFGNTHTLGFKHSEETKRKLSLIGKGRRHSKETKRKMSSAQMGHEFSKEAKLKISKTLKGYKHSKATKLKMSLAKQNQSRENEIKKFYSTYQT